MRIAHTSFHRRLGGQALQVLLLAREQQRRGHEVLVFTPPGSDLAARAEDAGVPVCTGCSFQRGFRPLRFWRDLGALVRGLRAARSQVVHAHGAQDTWLAVAARRLAGPEFVLVRTRHNLNPIRPHWFNRRLYGREIAHLIAVSEPVAARLLALDWLQPGRVSVIHPGLDNDLAAGVDPGARASVRIEFGLAPDAVLIGQVARLERDKGQEVLLRAFARLSARLPRAHLLLVGTGGDYHRLLSLHRELGLAGRVHFTLFRGDAPRLTAALDVAVCASLREGWGLSVLEAMLLEVPVVVTASGGPEVMVEHGRWGEVVPPGAEEALAAAVERTLGARGSPGLRERLRTARLRVEQEYLMRNVAPAVEAVYEQAGAACVSCT